jgi:hydrogenase expression/formation protein HypC
LIPKDETVIMCLAVPGQVESLFQQNNLRMGRVSFGGVIKEICLAYLPEIRIGDFVLVHVGFAISRIDEVSAMETLRTFEELGLLADELKELRETAHEIKQEVLPVKSTSDLGVSGEIFD